MRDIPAVAMTGNMDQADTIVLEFMIADVKTENPQEVGLSRIRVEDSESPSTSTIVNDTSMQTSAMWSPCHVGRRKDKTTCSWSKKEVVALLQYWANPAVQQELLRNVRNNAVYNSLSAKLVSLGFNKTAKKCKEKIKKLKQDYKKIKSRDHLNGGRTVWFDIIDEVLSSQAAASKPSRAEKSSSAMTTQAVVLDMNTEDKLTKICIPETQTHPKEPDFYIVEDCGAPSTSAAIASTPVQNSSMWFSGHVKRRKCEQTCSWSTKEVHALLGYWANPAVQEELLQNVRNNAVYNDISAKLASLGFDKSPQKCKEKIKKLKQDYRRIKNSQHACWSRTAWFGIMDEILSSQPAASRHLGTKDSHSTDSTHSLVLDVDADDETQWSPDEVQVLITLWAQPNIQKQLCTSAANNQVFTYLSNELALVGFNKTPQQCNIKVKKLKDEYKRMKKYELDGGDESDWFAVMDTVLGSHGEATTEMAMSTILAAPKSPEAVPSQVVWTSDEVDVLLTKWAAKSAQEQLRSAQEDERVYAQLSSELATQGFDKTTNQCRTKIRLLKQEYERIKAQKDSKMQKSNWFAIIDKVLVHSKPKSKTKLSANFKQPEPASQQASRNPPIGVPGSHLSMSSLCLLVPTLRLMCAFAWQVVQCCNVQHYGKVEELVELGTELAPDLLTPRERVQLLLRLRARLVLELCRNQSTASLLNIQPHLRAVQNLTIGSSCCQEELEELQSSKSNFVELVHTLLRDTEERRRFFKDVFPVHYGQQYEVTLQRLVWKFISRLDHLLPIPDIKQTAEWLSATPSVMEECGQLVLQPEQLKALLHFHEQQSGSTSRSSSQAQKMFLPELSLHNNSNTKRLPSEQLASTINRDDGWFNYCKGEKRLEENQSNHQTSLEDSGRENEDLIDDQSDDAAIANSSSLNPGLNHIPLHKHPCALCSYSDSHVSGLLQHITKEHLKQDSSLFGESRQDDFLQNVDAEMHVTDGAESGGFRDVATSNGTVKKISHPFKCDKCDKRYASKSSLRVHNRIHTGEAPFLCSHCGHSFRSSTCLELHLRTHTGERPYKCHICGKTSVQHMGRHMRMHRGEKNYLCAECGKTFLSSGELKLHMRSHTGERPYTCKHCGKGFIAKCLLTVHLRRHTGENPYRCSMCPKSFPTLRAQKKHMKIHTSKKSFQCLKCGRIFRQEDTFKLHIETHDTV